MTDPRCEADQQAHEVPLVEQLRGIPKDYRTCRAIQWSDDGRETGHQFIPVGVMMHRAADMIEALQSATQRSGLPDAWLEIDHDGNVMEACVEKDLTSPFKWKPLYLEAPQPASAPSGMAMMNDESPTVGEGIDSPMNACMFRDRCRAMKAALSEKQAIPEPEAEMAIRRVAIEFGYRCCEKGMNLQAALAAAPSPDGNEEPK